MTVMGFHHVYDNANVKQCRWMISEIEDHIDNLLESARDLRRRNASRKRRRRANPNDETISEDESPGSDDDELGPDEPLSSDDEEEEEKEDTTPEKNDADAVVCVQPSDSSAGQVA